MTLTSANESEGTPPGGAWRLSPPAALVALLAAAPTRLYTLEHAAEMLDASVSTIRRLLQDGQLREVRLSAHMVRVRADDLAAYIDRCTTEDDLDAADVPEPDRRRHGAHGP